MRNLVCTALEAAPGVTLYHTGPALKDGPFPSLFYFSLSGADSLTLDPYNQPIQFLSDFPIHCFSLTLPAHENGLSPQTALSTWVEDLEKGIDIFDDFLRSAQLAVNFAINEGFTDPHNLATAGLSRGAFFACHLAARDPRFRHILCYAPLTRLEKAKEFQDLQDHPLVKAYDLFAVAPEIADRNIRFYIGNKDTRVDTQSCLDLALHLVEKSPKKTAPIELIMSPSIGQFGHGTSPETFRQGAEWLRTLLMKN